VDTGFSSALVDGSVKICSGGHYNVTTSSPGIGMTHPHGSIVAQAIGEYMKKVDYCLVIVTAGPSHEISKAAAKGLEYLVKMKIKFANMSTEGPDYDYDEYDAIQSFVSQGGKLFLAAGNRTLNLNEVCNSYPACYGIPGTVVVGALEEKHKTDYTNYGSIVTRWEDGRITVKGDDWNGTSFAAPRALATYVRYLASHPERL